ncbi:unnamed protein product [Caenorhabditis bovis]|uniref:Craniofacial development protein 1 n=1 Tax=Caenorhabditis bovis TaxID=2654633 RepID=A0A8S1F535_9PELO|nr:unnamed protein product [Caenorhabditis bovis]
MASRDDDDDYHSSDDEDYNPEDDEINEQDEIDDAEDAEVLEDEKIEHTEEKTPEASTSGSSATDVDALFAELTGEDPILVEAARRNQSSTLTRTEKSETPTTNTTASNSKESLSVPDEIEALASECSSSQSEDGSTAEKGSPKPEKSDEKAPPKKRLGLMEAALTMSKRSKISVLEKSDRDWMAFKDEHKLVEDLESHNRGKGGFLNRMDFLNRTDNRQFENEKNMRAISRKDRV